MSFPLQDGLGGLPPDGIPSLDPATGLPSDTVHLDLSRGLDRLWRVTQRGGRGLEATSSTWGGAVNQGEQLARTQRGATRVTLHFTTRNSRPARLTIDLE